MIANAGGANAQAASIPVVIAWGAGSTPPSVTGLSPTSGASAGGTSVTISGTNFTGATAVKFGTRAATNFTVNSATQITATSPAGSGTVDVTVVTPAGTSAIGAADQFTYTAAGGGSVTPTVSYDSHGNTTGLGAQTLIYDGADRQTATVTGTTTVRYTRDANDRIVVRDVTGTVNSSVHYGFTAPGDTPDLTLDAGNHVIERIFGLLGGVLVTKRGAGDTWSYPNVDGDLIASANSTGAKQGQTMSYDPFGQALGSVPDNSAGNLDNGWLGQHQR